MGGCGGSTDLAVQPTQVEVVAVQPTRVEVAVTQVEVVAVQPTRVEVADLDVARAFGACETPGMSCTRLFLALLTPLGFLVSACGSSVPQQPAVPEVAIAVPSSPAPHADDEGLARNQKGTRPKTPAGYQEMTVLGVEPTTGGAAVLLTDDRRSVIVPIYVGGTEAYSIDLRLSQQRPERPLTHDLLDSILRELETRLVKVQVDELRGDVFIGSVFLERGDKMIEIDARPSDAMALAIGNHVPIFVAHSVIEKAGIKKNDVEDDQHSASLSRTKL